MLKNSKNILLGVTLAVGIGLAGLAVAHPNAQAEKEAVVQTQDQKEKATAHAVTNLQIGVETFDRINEAIDKKEKLSQEKIDELTYYMIQYANAPQFVSEDQSSVHTADVGFSKLIELYKQSDVDPSFEITENGIKTLRDIKKPASFKKDAQKAQEKAEKAADAIVPDSVKETNETKEVEINTNNGNTNVEVKEIEK